MLGRVARALSGTTKNMVPQTVRRSPAVQRNLVRQDVRRQHAAERDTIYCTLLNLSLVSLPPPFLLFLGVIAKDITGSGTNIEVIASCVLSIVSAEEERVQRGCPISSFEVTSPQAPNGMAKRRAAAVPFLSLDMLYSPVKISPTGSLSPNMNTHSAGVRDFVLASATQNQHRLHKCLSRFSPNQ